MLIVGVAAGLEIVVLLNPAAGDHEYVPLPLPLSVVADPGHIETSGPALAAGSGFTVASTMVLVEVQPLFVAST